MKKNIVNDATYKPVVNDELLDPDGMGPSDVAQAKVRVGILAAIAAYSVLIEAMSSDAVRGALSNTPFLIAVAYLCVAGGMLLWSARIAKRRSTSAEVIFKRVLGTVLDMSGVAAFMCVTGAYAPMLYPLFLTIIVGNSIRYGRQFMYLSIVTAAIGMVFVWAFNPIFKELPALTAGYVAGILAIPLYNRSLIKTLQTLLQKQREIDDAKTRFIANISHELRTPLHGILANSELMKEARSARKEDAEQLSAITSSAEHLLSIVNNILEVAKYQGDAPKQPELEEVHLFEAVRSSVDICAPAAREKHLSLRFAYDFSLPNRTISSKQTIREILVNIIGNAIKYTDKGTVSILAEKSGDSLRVTVVDTGIGIPKSKLDRVFEPFIQVDDTVRRKQASTGLGLTLSKQMVASLGGSISLSSQLGNGTTCSIVFPLSACSNDGTTAIVGAPPKCMLISNEHVGAKVTATFAEAGWDVVTRNYYSFIEALISGEVSNHTVFLDTSGHFDETLIEHIARDRSSNRYILLGRSIDARHLEILSFQGLVSELDVRSLANVRMPTIEDNAAGGTEKDERGQFRLNILVADDSPVNLRTARASLESAGHSVLTASDGTETLDLLEASENDGMPFNIIFLDFHMPDMSGVEVVKLYGFMSDDPAPVVMVTADVTDEARQAADAVGVRGFLTKPYRPNEIRESALRFSRHPEQQEAADENGCDLLIDRSDELRLDQQVVPIEAAFVISTELEELRKCGVANSELRSMVVEYTDDAFEAIASADRALTLGRLSSVRESMHALKGASRQIGAVAVGRRAAVLEKAGAGVLQRDARTHFKEMRRLLSQSRDRLIELATKPPESTSA